MKRIAILALVLIMACGCERYEPQADNVSTFSGHDGNDLFRLLMIDGCDYLNRVRYVRGDWTTEIVHKGNCKSCRKWLIEAIHARAEKGNQ